VGLAVVVAVALAMLLSIYIMLARRRRSANSGSGVTTRRIPVIAESGGGSRLARTDVVGTLQRTCAGATPAYTITINSAGAAAELDEAMLPLEEDKTRF